jgi:hypothetical protein
MSEVTQKTFSCALNDYIAARKAAETAQITVPGTPEEIEMNRRAEDTHTHLRNAAGRHAEESGPVDPVMQPEGPDFFAPAPLVAEYERLRDDPAADRADVLAAAEALAAARQAHRVTQGLPIASATGG